MPWYRITLTMQVATIGEHRVIQKEFEAILSASGNPRNAGLFGSANVGAKTLTLYFSPGAYAIAANLIDRYGGQACEAPRLSDVDVLRANSLPDIPFAAEQ
jgi:hypothetical protein